MARQKNDGAGNHGVKRGPNKIPKETKLMLRDIIMSEDNIERIKTSLQKLYDEEEYYKFLLLNKDYMEFFLPKQAAIKVAPDENTSDLKSELMELSGL